MASGTPPRGPILTTPGHERAVLAIYHCVFCAAGQITSLVTSPRAESLALTHRPSGLQALYIQTFCFQLLFLWLLLLYLFPLSQCHLFVGHEPSTGYFDTDSMFIKQTKVEK